MRASINSLRGEKAVGHILKPETDSILAGQWLAHCLDPERREKLSLAQIRLIFSMAKDAGQHDGFELFAAACGYHVTAVIDPQTQIADMLRKAQQANRESAELTEEAIARARAQGLKLE